MSIKKRVTVTINGESITAAPSTLNQLGIWIYKAEEAYKTDSRFLVLAQNAQKAFNEIHDQLDALGYYDNIR